MTIKYQTGLHHFFPQNGREKKLHSTRATHRKRRYAKALHYHNPCDFRIIYRRKCTMKACNIIHQFKMLVYLASHHYSSRYKWHVGILLQSVVKCNNMKNIQQLTFVFMNSLHLNIKQRCRIDVYTIFLLNKLSQFQLVFLKTGKQHI